MEELINDLVKKYPNHADLGKAVHRIHLMLNVREKGVDKEWDKINSHIEIKQFVKEL